MKKTFKRNIKDFLTLQRQKRVLPKSLKKSEGKKILLISHQLTTTGSPLVLFYLTKELLKNGFNPVVVSYKGGSLVKEFKKIGVEVLCGEIYNDDTEVLKDLASNFDKVIVNSILCYSAVEAIKNSIWWIHEGQNIELSFMLDFPKLEEVLRNAKNVFVVSEYAKQVVDKFNPNSKIIRLGIEDNYKQQNNNNKRIKFGHVGNVSECRAQDVLIEAILKLEQKYLDECEFHFFCEKRGRNYRKIVKQTKDLNNIFFDGLIYNQNKKWTKFSELDAFIIPSRDESCSLVALEACMLKKPIIVSENVGAKYMVRKGENGYIIPTGNSDELKNAIESLIVNKNELKKMGKVSREMYEEYASYENHIKELQQLIDMCKN